MKHVHSGVIPRGASVVLNCSGAAKPGGIDPSWLDGVLDVAPAGVA